MINSPFSWISDIQHAMHKKKKVVELLVGEE